MAAAKDLKKPGERTVKRLFALSSNRCAFPKCTVPIIQNDTTVGDICHIKGTKPGAARYDRDQSEKQRHAFENLILMCRNHHKIIDDDEESYTPDRLYKLKAQHETQTVRLPESVVSRAASLLLMQNSVSVQQSGNGNIATVVNGDVYLPPAVVALKTGAPDWRFYDLFHYIRPTAGHTEALDYTHRLTKDSSCIHRGVHTRTNPASTITARKLRPPIQRWGSDHLFHILHMNDNRG